jgi:hypothetical protein
VQPDNLKLIDRPVAATDTLFHPLGLEHYIYGESRNEEYGELEDKSVEIAFANTISQVSLSGKQVSHASHASPFTKSCAMSGDAFCVNNDKVSLASPNQAPDMIQLDQVKESIFRIGHSDTWGCKHCKIKDDRWFMEKHNCSGLQKMFEKASRLKENDRLPSTDIAKFRGRSPD